jgi:hypothetical protein
MENTQKVKKVYEKPEIEVIDLQEMPVLLSGSYTGPTLNDGEAG